ncbi:nitroreductase family protein [Thalassotalea psychrophila]|uniref:Putative NAD(P)H nitroreductase n=1 Tax=Thalassotalea psychrophila TaxID=3065647 RepID=A0ABY9TP59_9GAMM|nr:nitroreductase family protein [Colwelliaceae bacterium SQ149]
MSAIKFLLSRQSNGFLAEPGPSPEQLKSIFATAMAVPDHAGLNPYKFHQIEGDGLTKLTNIYVDAIKAITNDEFKIAKAEKMAYRAPLLIVVSTDYKKHPKVPEQEQLVTAGCAAHAVQMASTALGFGSMWRTGDVAYSNIVKKGLGISANNDIVGFIYIGSKSKELPNKTRKTADDFIEIWQ